MSSGEDLDRVPPSSVASIATSVGVESLPDEVARALASDAEYRLREVIQDAVKFMRHSKRSKLSTEDVNSSLQLRDVEPLYGFPAGSGPIAFREVPNHPELFYQEQRELELKDILATKLPKPPVAVNVVRHAHPPGSTRRSATLGKVRDERRPREMAMKLPSREPHAIEGFPPRSPRLTLSPPFIRVALVG